MILQKGNFIMLKTKLFSAKLLALALVLASGTVSANIDYHRLIWDADPAHQAVIGFSQIDSNEIATVKYGYSTDENNWSLKSVSNSQGFDGNNFTSSFVRLTGLAANSAVYYRVCEGNSCGERLWFKTAPTDNSPFVMLSGGDTRTGWSTRILGNQLLAKIRPLFIMHGGDFTSANNASQMEGFLTDWQLTFSNDIIDGIAYKRIYPLVPTFGNHEDDDYCTLCKVFGVDYNDDEECTDYDTYGAFDISPLLRIYTLNSEYKNSGWSTQAAAQANWLASDLAANSGNVSWRFAQYHKPLFPHSTSKSENPTLFNWWADEFYNNAMNLVFESDTHLSKVTSPVEPVGNTFQVTTTGGTVYAGEGSWGAPARSANKNYPWTLENESIQQFKILTISSDKVEIRTAQFDSGASTDVSTISAQERADNTTVLPTGVDWWSTNGIGNVITLTRSNNELSLLNHGDDTSSGPGPAPEPPSDNMILNVVADTFISEKLLNQNFNAVTDQLLADGNDGTYGPIKMLLAWDVSAIESCSVVTAASIEMQIFNASPGTYEVYSSVNAWLENEVTWSSLPGAENQGTLMGSFMPDTIGSHTVSLSADGLSIVQNWITGSDTNDGVVIISESTNDGIDVEDREQGMAVKLGLTLDNSDCADTIVVNGATFVSQDVPTSIISGETVSVSVTLNNAGTSTWTVANGHKLGSQNAQDNTTWGFNRVPLTQDVAPGANVTFTFDVTAPSTDGSYEFQWKMLQESVQWFGENTPNISINVSSTSVETILSTSYFETDWDGWIDGDGTGELVKRQLYASRAAEGDYSIKIKDNEVESSAVTSPTYDISGYDQITIDYQYYPHNQAGSDGYFVQYYDGSTWQTIATYVVGTDFQNGQFYSVSLTLSSSSYTFPVDAKFRFESNGGGGGRHIYIDAVIITATTAGPNIEECAIGEATKDNITHNCTYNLGDTAQGNFRMKYPEGEWISIGCSGGKPVADNSNTQWVQSERTIRIIGGDYLQCGELDQECTCNAGSGERFHGISPDYLSSNGLTHAIDYPGGGYVFNNSAHQTCLGIHKQGNAGEIESIWTVFNSNHDHQESSGDHTECPLFCLGDACP